jgi:tungstate transport system substrate-binding protein
LQESALDDRDPSPAMNRRLALAALLAAFVAFAAGMPRAQAADTVTLAVTPTVHPSGLSRSVLAAFAKSSGVEVRTIAGDAHDIARRGDADAALGEAGEAQKRFMDEGWGASRTVVMRSALVLVGPKNDPAHAAERGFDAALQSIARGGFPFVSSAWAPELRAWSHAGVDTAKARATWIRSAPGSAAIATAAARNAYVLVDRATWLTGRRNGLAVFAEGDASLANEYAIVVVNPAKYPRVKADAARALAAWLASSAGQQAIAEFRIEGESPFAPL